MKRLRPNQVIVPGGLPPEYEEFDVPPIEKPAPEPEVKPLDPARLVRSIPPGTPGI